jgi:peptidyl-dipeptidase Dcp
LVLGAAAVLAKPATGARPAKASAEDATAPTADLLAPWSGPLGGVPPFDKVRVADFESALTRSMVLGRAEIDAIAANPAPPTFENTLVALERAGAALDRVITLFYVHVGTLSNPHLREVEKQMAPRLSAFAAETTQNATLYARIDTVQRARPSPPLRPEQRRLVEVVQRQFALRGAALAPAAKAQIKNLDLRLSSLYTQFRQNQLADEEKYSLVLQTEAELEGLPNDLREAAAAAAAVAGMPGRWLISNTRSSMEPFLTASRRRDLRENGWRLWVGRGDNGDANDNKAVIVEILQLRGERARLLGYPTHAHWITDDGMARTPDAALALMLRVWQPALARAREEIADMQALAARAGDRDSGGAPLRIEPWDYRYYAEKVRLQRYDFDGEALKPYLVLDRMREAMFWAAGQLYGLGFRRLQGLPLQHPDVTVYLVQRRGRPVGLWYFDPFARAGKQSGAWMNEYRTQEHLRRRLPIVSNNANFIPGGKGEPVLISWDDAQTLFHEFGHALHGLLSDVTYPSLAGTSVKRDFVEFPSQLNERWLRTPELLKRFARHHRTGQPIPPELLAALDRSRHFNQGFQTAEYLASALYDMKIHLAPTAPDPARFERETMAEIGCPPEITMRHRPTHFGHIFGGDGYSAGYYSYLWADVLTADAAEAYTQAGGWYDKTVARRLHDQLLRVGNSLPPEEAYRRFRGRDPDPEALLRARGFAPTRLNATSPAAPCCA